MLNTRLRFGGRSSACLAASSISALGVPTLAAALASCGRGAVNASPSASAAWASELDKMLRQREVEKRKFESLSKRTDLSPEEAAKMQLVSSLLNKDDELFELKRINMLSLERVGEHQRRTMQNSEEKGIYTEEAINRQVLDAFTNTEYNKKKVRGHALQARKMRYVFIVVKFLCTLSLWWLIHWWYTSDPNLMWVDKPSKVYRPNITAKDVGILQSNPTSQQARQVG